jgi:hypothetical protein
VRQFLTANFFHTYILAHSPAKKDICACGPRPANPGLNRTRPARTGQTTCSRSQSSHHLMSRSSFCDRRMNARSCLRSSMAAFVYRPCLSAFSFPLGALDPGAPPCIRQRLLPCTAGDLQGLPERVLAPTIAAVAKAGEETARLIPFINELLVKCSTMASPEQYRLHAEECRRMARLTADPDKQACWREITENWLRLAQDAEDSLQKVRTKRSWASSSAR